MHGPLALGALSGALTAAAIPPSPSPLFTIVAMAPLFAAVALARRVRVAAVAGLIAGVVATGVSFRFLLPPMRDVGGLSPLAAAAAYAALTAWHAAPFALAAALGAIASRRGGNAPLAAAVALAALERVWPVPIPWCFGAGLEGVPYVPMSAAVLGPAGPTLAVLLASAALAEALAVAAAPKPARADRRAGWAFVAVGSFALVGGYALERALAAEVAAAPTLAVGLVQPGPRTRGPLEAMLATTDRLASEGAELVVWSEGALPGVVDARDADGLVEATLADHGGRASVLVGAVTSGARGFENAAVLEGRAGDRDATYAKRSLLPFAERLPLEAELPWLRALSPRSGRFVPGTSRPPIVVRGAPVAIAICYEDLLSDAVRASANASHAELLVNLTNDAWFAGSAEPETHAAMARLRAIELGRALVRSTTDGTTIAFGPDGSTLARAPRGEAAGFVAIVPLLRSETFYARHGAWPAWATMLALALFGARRVSPGATRPRRAATS